MDGAINKGHKIGILTARGNKNAIFAGIKNKILYKNKKGGFEELPEKNFKKRWCFSVNDIKDKNSLKIDMGSSSDPSIVKAYILQKILADKEGFARIYFYDDDAGTIGAVNNLNDERIKGIKV